MMLLNRDTPCSHDGCDKNRAGGSFCVAHRAKSRRNLEATTVDEKCSVGSCQYRKHSRGMCLRHYETNDIKQLAAKKARRLASFKLNCEFIDLVKGEPCVDCKNEFQPVCMDFDHVRGVKVGDVSSMRCRALSIIIEEIKKCDIVCANCHRIRTKSRRVAE